MSLNKQLLTQKKHNFGKMKKNIVVRLENVLVKKYDVEKSYENNGLDEKGIDLS